MPRSTSKRAMLSTAAEEALSTEELMPFAEVARFGNDADDDKFRRGFARQPQMSQRLLKSWVVARQTKLGPMRQKVGFAVDTQRSRLLVRLYSICDYDQVRAVQIRREIQARCAEVKDLNIRAAFILATKLFDSQGTKAVIAHQHVS